MTHHSSAGLRTFAPHKGRKQAQRALPRRDPVLTPLVGTSQCARPCNTPGPSSRADALGGAGGRRHLLRVVEVGAPGNFAAELGVVALGLAWRGFALLGHQPDMVDRGRCQPRSKGRLAAGLVLQLGGRRAGGGAEEESDSSFGAPAVAAAWCGPAEPDAEFEDPIVLAFFGVVNLLMSSTSWFVKSLANKYSRSHLVFLL